MLIMEMKHKNKILVKKIIIIIYKVCINFIFLIIKKILGKLINLNFEMKLF